MSVTIQVSGSLKERAGAATVIENVRTVGEAVAQLPVPKDMGLVIMVNGRLADWRTELKDGDVLQLLPVIGGGSSRGRVGPKERER